MAERRTIEVCADWVGIAGPRRVGWLHAISTRGKEVFSFEYEDDWLKERPAVSLDPGLRLLRGAQYPAEDKPSFGVFLDSSPDRWGRVLLQRREARLAREEGRAERRLGELDYLLGVYDGHRQGGLRFRLSSESPFLDDNAELASPPWTSLRELEQASLMLERSDAEREPGYDKWLRMLIAPGRSLGGARPKASVLDPGGALWIAKFPSSHDTEDIGGWESVLHSLAGRAGIAVTEAKHQKLASRHHTFLARRFDRGEQGTRRHFASAMTLLDRNDGDEPASYLDLAGVLAQHGARAKRDLEELWRRIVFFVLVSNADDHLRNHGFLLEPNGWSLAPAYDMNPIATADGLTLNISETDNQQDLALVRDVAKHFRVTQARADAIIDAVTGAVRTWRTEASRLHIPRDEQERMAPAFRLAE